MTDDDNRKNLPEARKRNGWGFPMDDDRMSLGEAEGWFDYWATIGTRTNRGDADERAAAEVLRAEYDRRGEALAERDRLRGRRAGGAVVSAPEVWWSPSRGVIWHEEGTHVCVEQDRVVEVGFTLPDDAVQYRHPVRSNQEGTR